ANLSPLKDFIQFDINLLGATLNVGELAITDELDITGLGSGVLTIDGSGLVFQIDDGTSDLINVDISGIGLLGRNVVSTENLSLTDMVFTGNSTTALSHQVGKLTIEDSTFTGNTTMGSGGA